MYPIISSQPIVIKETYLDLFGHMNHAHYLTMLEQARWDLITASGYGIEKIRETGLGPTILGLELSFKREVRNRDIVIIQSQMISYEKKIGVMSQAMLRGKEICCEAKFTFGLFSVTERRLVLPTPEWLHTLGIEAPQG